MLITLIKNEDIRHFFKLILVTMSNWSNLGNLGLSFSYCINFTVVFIFFEFILSQNIEILKLFIIKIQKFIKRKMTSILQSKLFLSLNFFF